MVIVVRYEKATRSKIRWAMKAYVRWMRCRNYQVEHGLISVDRKVPSPDELIQLDKNGVTKALCLFILEVRNANGDDYTRDTLYDMIVMIQSFFKENGRPLKFFEDDDFFHVKNTLDNRMKDLSKQGKIAPREKAKPISCSEEQILWEKGVLGDDSPKKLVDTLMYLLGVHFALRAADEHKSLKIGDQITVKFDEAMGLKYLFYEENTSKCNQGGLASRGLPPKTGRAYENVVNSDRCVVRIYEKYVSLRPSHLPKCSTDLYLRPLTVPNGDVWFSCQPRGRHTLEKVVKKLCEAGGITGKRSNHSCRASSATRLYEEGVDEQLICEKTGHRSVAVRSYKRTSNKQLKGITDILYGNSEGNEAKKVKHEVTATISKNPQNENVASNVKSHVEVDKIETPETTEKPSNAIELAKGLVVHINFNVNK